MIEPKINPSFAVSKALASAFVHLENDQHFQVVLKMLEERRDALALGAAMPQDLNRRAETCGRVQELVDIISAAKGARKMNFSDAASSVSSAAKGGGW